MSAQLLPLSLKASDELLDQDCLSSVGNAHRKPCWIGKGHKGRIPSYVTAFSLLGQNTITASIEPYLRSID